MEGCVVAVVVDVNAGATACCVDDGDTPLAVVAGVSSEEEADSVVDKTEAGDERFCGSGGT